MRTLRTAAFLLTLPVIAASNSGLIQVTGVRSWSHPDYTRVIFDTTGAFQVHSERVFNPDRIYFDISHARPWIGGRRYFTHPINDAFIHRVRVAETTPGTTRIVFDLAVPASFRMMRLDHPDRMVIEIRPNQPEIRPSQPEAPARVTVSSVISRDIPAPMPYIAPVNKFPYPPAVRQARIALLLGDTAPFLDTAPLVAARYPDSAFRLSQIRPKQALIVRAAAPQPLPPPVVLAPAISKPLPYDARAKASENASRSLTRALGLKVNRIVIDAGHGGHDDGTIGPNGVLEKDVVLDVALRLSKLVQSKMGAEVVLTRSDDTFIPLHERTNIANQQKADLFLSIHANSSPAPSVAGTETFFLNLNSSPGALDVAARENAGSDKTINELKDLIQSITLNDKIAESETFAQNIQTAINSQAAKSNVAARNRGVKRAPFVVLIGAGMPSVLAEIGFLSNARDEANLNKPEYRQKIAEALYKGLSQYSQSLSHFEVATTKNSKSE